MIRTIGGTSWKFFKFLSLISLLLLAPYMNTDAAQGLVVFAFMWFLFFGPIYLVSFLIWVRRNTQA